MQDTYALVLSDLISDAVADDFMGEASYVLAGRVAASFYCEWNVMLSPALKADIEARILAMRGF
jgi:hypothetical protein